MHIKNYREILNVGLLAFILVGCQGGGDSPPTDEKQPDYKPVPKPEKPESDFASTPWPFEQNSSDLVAAAKVAGYYAVANTATNYIEIRNISHDTLNVLSQDDFLALEGLASSGADFSLCGMTFTPSGRFLYLAMCGQGDELDHIVAFNQNTKVLSLFDSVSLRADIESPSDKYGMTYFKKHLYVGSEKGVFRYDADKNSVYFGGAKQAPDFIPSPRAIIDLALDMKQEKLYALSEQSIYRMAAEGSSLSEIYSGAEFESITYSRVFGRDDMSGLYLSVRKEADDEFWLFPKDDLKGSIKTSPKLLCEVKESILSTAATADGKLLYTDGSPKLLADKLDDKLSYNDWLYDELRQYVATLKSLTSSRQFATTNDFSPEGFLHRKIQRKGTNPNKTPIADTVGWAVFTLLAADKVLDDPEIEPIITLLIKRHAGLMEDGLGGLKSVDGHFVRNYQTNGSPHDEKPQPQLYTSMKFLPAVIKAAEQYPDNVTIEHAKQYLTQIFVRSGDTIRARQGVTWQNDDFGPLRNDNGMANETWIYGDLGAAQDPHASYNYDKYVSKREYFKYDHWLEGEPVIKASHSAFIVMGGTLILAHHAEDPEWKQFNENYYAISQAETDDLGSPYFAAFSAGNNTAVEGNYNNDGPSQHPGDILHFPAVLGFGQHGKQGAMVGGYFAYRDELRQKMVNASGGEDIEFLTRWSMSLPDYQMSSVGIADFWFGAIGLVETIRPGTVDELRNTFYRHEVSWHTNKQGQQVVLFSAFSPREVIGIDRSGDQQSFGYQRSPYTVPSDSVFERFEVVDPEGDWIELDDIVNVAHGKEAIFTNPNFEDGLNGWQAYGDALPILTDGISGKGVKLVAGSSDRSLISQSVKQDLSLVGSEYRVSAYIKPETVDSSQGYIQAYWTAEGEHEQVIGTVSQSQKLTDSDEGQLVAVDTVKPEGASYLHIEYVVEGGAGEAFMFDNTALQVFGKPVQILNGDFESGSQYWDLSNGLVTIDKGNVAPQGEQALVFLSNGTTSKESEIIASTPLDITSDPDGTRYVFTLSVGEKQLAEGAYFDVDVEVESASTKTKLVPSVATIENDSGDMIRFVMRKRPDETAFNIILRMTESTTSSSLSRIVVDDLRLFKHRILPAICNGSATGC